ncbi:MAG: hypothetical protein IT463_10065 [Planctomycetes bacterium]|nr:hypothetical protein [Planctomycetota bacterium]
MLLAIAVLAVVYVSRHGLRFRPAAPQERPAAPAKPASPPTDPVEPFPVPGFAGLKARFSDTHTAQPVVGAAALDCFDAGGWTRAADLKTTSADGVLRADRLPTGQDLRLCVRSNCHVPWCSRAFRLAPGQVLDLCSVGIEPAWPVAVTLDRGPETGAITVEYERFWPPPELDQLELREDSAGYGRTRFAAGTWLARARDSSGREVQACFDVTPDTTSVLLPLRLEGVGSVRVEGLAPRRGKYVLWRYYHSGGWQEFSEAPARSGHVWGDLPHGRYRVEARDAQGRGRFAPPVEVDADNAVRAVTVPGTKPQPQIVRVLLTRRGVPLAGRSLWVEDSGGAFHSATTRDDGWAELVLETTPVQCGALWRGGAPWRVSPLNKPLACVITRVELEPAGFLPLNLSGLLYEQFCAELAEQPPARNDREDDNAPGNQQPEQPPAPPEEPEDTSQRAKDRPLGGVTLRLPRPAKPPESNTNGPQAGPGVQGLPHGKWEFCLFTPAGRLVHQHTAVGRAVLEDPLPVMVPAGEYRLRVVSPETAVYMERTLFTGRTSQPPPEPVVMLRLPLDGVLSDADAEWEVRSERLPRHVATFRATARKRTVLYLSPGQYLLVQRTERYRLLFSAKVAADGATSIKPVQTESNAGASGPTGIASYVQVEVQPPAECPVPLLSVQGAELAGRPGVPALMRTDLPFEVLRVPLVGNEAVVAAEGCEPVVLHELAFGVGFAPRCSCG